MVGSFLDVSVEGADGLQERLVVLRAGGMLTGEAGVFVCGRRIGRRIAIGDLLLVARDLGIVVEDTRLVLEDRGLRPLQDGERLHMLARQR